VLSGRGLLRVAWAFFVVGALLPPPAFATFKVSPTVLQASRKGGQALLGTIDVELRGERGKRFRTIVQDIQQLPDGSQAYAPPSGSPFSASSWISVSPVHFVGAPNRIQPVQYTVRVPANAEPGDHLASIAVQRLPRSGSATAAPIEAISVRLTIRVPGRADPEARIVSLDAPSVADGGPVNVGATVRNTGNLTLDFDRADGGRIAVVDGGEVKVATRFEGVLFPGQTRSFELAWDSPPLFGDLEAVASVDVGAQPVRETQGFWVVPWREIGALILVVLAVLTVALGVRRRRWGY
jgi:hypothetical protein